MSTQFKTATALDTTDTAVQETDQVCPLDSQEASGKEETESE